MKIGIFLPNATFDQPGTSEVGGIETYAFTVGEALQRMGHEVVLFGGKPKPGRTHAATTIPLELAPYWECRPAFEAVRLAHRLALETRAARAQGHHGLPRHRFLRRGSRFL